MKYTEEFSNEVRTNVMQTITAESREWSIDQDFGAKPRTETKYAAPEDLEFPEPEEEWDPQNSFFKYAVGTDEAYNEAFIKDWKTTNLRHLIREHDTLMNIKEELKKIYPQLISVYNKYSARRVKPDNVYISYTELVDLLSDFDIIDEDNFKQKDFDPIVNSTRENEPDAEIKFNDPMVRHEFLEALVRIGIEKHRNRGPAKNEHEAFAMLCEEIEDELSMLANGWKQKRYITQDMGVVMSSYFKILL